MEKMNVEEHLDEVLGIVEKPLKEIKKTEHITPIINGSDDETDFQYARENLYNLIDNSDYQFNKNHDGFFISFCGQGDPNNNHNMNTLKGCCAYFQIDKAWLKQCKKDNVIKSLIIDDDNLIIKFYDSAKTITKKYN